MAYIARRRIVVGNEPVFNEDGEQRRDDDGTLVYTDIVRMPGEVVPEADNWPQHLVEAHVRGEALQPDEMSLNGPALQMVRSLTARIEALEALAGITTQDEPVVDDETYTEMVADDKPGTTRRKKVA